VVLERDDVVAKEELLPVVETEEDESCRSALRLSLCNVLIF
jgi:hypothetical protein